MLLNRQNISAKYTCRDDIFKYVYFNKTHLSCTPIPLPFYTILTTKVDLKLLAVLEKCLKFQPYSWTLKINQILICGQLFWLPFGTRGGRHLQSFQVVQTFDIHKLGVFQHGFTDVNFSISQKFKMVEKQSLYSLTCSTVAPGEIYRDKTSISDI